MFPRLTEQFQLKKRIYMALTIYNYNNKNCLLFIGQFSTYIQVVEPTHSNQTAKDCQTFLFRLSVGCFRCYEFYFWPCIKFIFFSTCKKCSAFNSFFPLNMFTKESQIVHMYIDPRTKRNEHKLRYLYFSCQPL
jgi:hypothetical protein